MVEAEELCDRVAIINKGRVLACDTPANLKRDLQRDAIFEIEIRRGEVLLPQDGMTPSLLNGLTNQMLADQPTVKKAALTEMNGVAKLELVLVDESALATVINILSQKNIKVMRFTKREPTLEDVFMDRVGQRMEDVEKEESPNESN
jgi:ABC-2 type transport system ATP-binding protein